MYTYMLLVAECFLVIPEGINDRIKKFMKQSGHDKRQPIIIQAIIEFLTKNGF